MEIESQFITHEIEQDDQSYSGCGSDRKSTVTGSGIGVSFSDGIRVVRLDEEDGVYQGLRKRFFSLLGRDLGSGGVEVVAIHRKIWEAGDGDGGDGRLGKFLIRCNEVKRRDNKRVDLRRAWFGGSKDGIEKIVSRGLGDSEIMESNSSDNVDGVRLFAEEFLGESLAYRMKMVRDMSYSVDFYWES
ncbi:hypothetical protein Droror1_Dr00012365 [Drosera rotundifolia]